MRERPKVDGRVVVAYCRVSTAEQAAQGPSLEVQERTCRAYAAARFAGREVIVISETASGRRTGRRGYRSMMRQARLGDVYAIMAVELSRLWRTARDAMEASARLRDWGVELVITTMGLDTTTAAGKLMYGVMAMFAEFESNVISDRVRRVQADGRRRGRKGPGRRPYGWEVSAAGTLQKRDVEQSVVDEMLLGRAEGLSWGVLAERLNDRGVRTATGLSWDSAGLRLVVASAVKRRGQDATLRLLSEAG